MKLLLLIGLCLAQPQPAETPLDVQVDLAPDQPLHYVYADDVLIAEFRSNRDAAADVQVTVKAEHQQDAVQVLLESLTLRTHGSRWCALRGLPGARGFYETVFQIAVEDQTFERNDSFCRIDRLSGARPLPLTAISPDEAGNTLYALRAVAVNSLRLDGRAPDLAARIAETKAAGMEAVIALDARHKTDPAAVVSALENIGAKTIRRWDLHPRGDTALPARVHEAILKHGAAAPLALVIMSPADFLAQLEAGAGHFVHDAVLIPPETGAAASYAGTVSEAIRAVRDTAEEAGYEGWRFHLNGAAVHAAESNGAAFIQQRLIELAAGGISAMFRPEWVYNDGLREALVYLNGLAHCLPGTQSPGALPVSEGVHAPVFRRGGKWLIAIWSRKKGNSVSLPIGGAKNLALTDAFNNPLPLPEASEGAMLLETGPAPVYLSGSGGAVPGLAARNRARELAARFIEDARFREYLPEELIALMAGFAESEWAEANQRVAFFNLLRSFPVLEQQWHTGQLPQFVACPAISAIARICRRICIAEEDRGETFIQPIADTLAHCEELQSLYLTGSAAAAEARERGDWLLNEVRRLLDEVEILEAAGRRIEASAVAALADWRARTLQYAAEAGPFLNARDERRAIEADIREEEEARSQAEAETSQAEETAEKETPDNNSAATPSENTEAREAPPETEQPEFIFHTVERGDNPSKIADKYGMELDEFLKLNNMSRNRVISIGDQFKVKAPAGTADDSSAAADSGQKKIVHTVRSGDNLSVIANKYSVKVDDLLKWNNLTKRSVLHIGDKLEVHVDDAR
jgi:LysM repeat protein